MLTSPKICQHPKMDKLIEANKVLNDWWLHYYQLLYHNNPSYTSPDGIPFKVHFAEPGVLSLRITHHEVPMYSFSILGCRGKQSHVVLSNCDLILWAIKNKKERYIPMACCPLASPIQCVCAYAFDCPLHGKRHIGTHD